jgi:hypothetical protein
MVDLDRWFAESCRVSEACSWIIFSEFEELQCRGQPVAALGSPKSLVALGRQPRRTLPEYEALMRQHAHPPVAEDLDPLRGSKQSDP